MSIYIKGMEIPTSCTVCCFRDNIWCRAYPGRSVIEAKENGKMDDDCPLVLVPPHGRLIDADKPKPYMLNEHYRYRRVYDADEIENAPTIIPADKEEP